MPSPIGEAYVSLEDLKFYLTIDVETYDSVMIDALDSASREVERLTNRQFNLADTETARRFKASDYFSVDVDDFVPSETMIVETARTSAGPWRVVSSGYDSYPLDGIVNGQTGWPCYQLKSVDRRPVFDRWVRLTAQWGWTDVPAPVRQACMVIAAETFQMKDAPFGVAGSDQFGAILRVRDNEAAKGKLRRYARYPILVG